LQGWTPTENFDIAHEMFVACIGSVDVEAAKFALVMKKSTKAIEVSSMCQSTADFLEKLVSTLSVLVFCGSSPSLTRALVMAVK
jgi:hypothetical protein